MAESTEWQINLNGEDWTILVSRQMAYGLGPRKKAWVEGEVAKLYPGSMDGPNPSHHAGTTFCGGGKEVEVAIDYDFAEKTVSVCEIG